MIRQVIAIILQILFFAAQLACVFIIYRRIKQTTVTMIKFHDYLIEYRLTPRSRILRKHLPKMSMVMEEESCMDSSSMALSQSQSRLTSTSRMMSAISRRTMAS